MISRIFRLFLCLFSLTIFLIVSIISHIFISILCPKYRWIYFSYLNRIFARSLRVISGARVVVEGKSNIPATTGNLIISNHLTYLDGVVIGSIFPVIYLSKKEIKNWPLIGWMTSVSGTIFIDRKRRDESHKYVDEIAKKLRDRINVLLFPEGTSTNGECIRDFQSVFFEAPLSSRSYILPITIHYTKINNEPITKSNRDKICWYGQIPFRKHIWQLLQQRSVEAIVNIHPIIDINKLENSSLGRKELARHAYQIINKEYFKSHQ
ncbi:MAG: 1-acyl-sn-glycerol-3-phosphate acyltransferase [Candidatus Omnitrophica bacterium]|nr:1-acyl-sn-glycerol-3-phosphate acyltransferase [Candidatus Omnitrophota bacterium]